MCETMFFFSVQVRLDPWTVLYQPDLQRYLFWAGKVCFYVFMLKKCACGHGLREAHTRLISLSVCPSVCSSVRNTKTRRFFTQELNQGVHVEFSVRRPSPPNNYSYVLEENLGSARKFVQNYLLFTYISYLILAIHTQSMSGLEESF